MFEVRFTPLTPVELGVWCDTCALPSAGRLSFASEYSSIPMCVATFIWCPDCGQGVYE